jgi:lipopolysaccharide export system protein LptA
VSGDELKARFATVAGKDAIQTLDGAGHTVVHQVGADGTDQTSKGATLAVSFRQGATEKHGDTAQIEHAAQGGGVTIVRTAPARASARILGVKATAAKSAVPSVEHASGEQAVYEADGDRLTLTGGARVEDAASVLLADAVTMQQGTGDATAEGNVRVSYLSSDAAGGASGAGSEPLHITAARAVEKKAAGPADFFGAAGKDARMWQGSSQVQAPVLNFFQTENDPASRRLIAHGEIAGDADFVRAVLVSEGSHAEGRGKREKGRESDGGPVRIVGHTMTYLAGPRTVEFDGKVKVEGQDGVLTAEKAIAYLAEAGAAAKPGGAAAAAGATLMAGRIERMVAHGGVEIEEPGRTGTGEQLVYTASDQTFVLTGTKAVPPKVVDDVQGTTTGAVLRFRSGDHSVVVSGDGAGPKVRSETRVKQ